MKWFLSITSLLCFLYGQATSIPAVAILDFESRGLPTYEVETLTERLRSEAANTNAIRLIDRKMLESILNEQGLQQSGCTTDECAAEVGELLGAQFMISGSIGKLGDTYTIDAKMVSVTTGAAVRAKTVTYKGEVSGLILEMEILAWEIVGLKAPQRLLFKRGSASMGDKMTVAILDFEPRGISTLESQTLTDRFATEINNTGKAILVDRNSMREVMQEQGYTEVECSSEECAAEVGAMLGVQFMINGAIGKLGDTYTIDAKMFEVATGAAAKTKNTTYTGLVDGLITEIEILAWEMMGLTPPDEVMQKRQGWEPTVAKAGKTRFGALMRSTLLPGLGQFYSDRNSWGWIWLGSEIAVSALAYSQYSKYQTSHDNFNQFYNQYHVSSNPIEKQDFRMQAEANHQELSTANEEMTMMLYALGGIWVANMIHAYMTGPSDVALEKEKPSVELVLNEYTKEPQLRLTWSLDK